MEDIIVTSLVELLRSETKLIDLVGKKNPTIAELNKLKTQSTFCIQQLEDENLDVKRQILQSTIQNIKLTASSVTLAIDKSGLTELLVFPLFDEPAADPIIIPIRMRRRGVKTKLIIDSPHAENRNVDDNLCRLIAQAHSWFEQLTSGDASTVREIAKREQINEHEITRVLHLAFLSPKIVEDVLDGRQPEGMTVHRLRRLSSIPSDWMDQTKMLENLI